MSLDSHTVYSELFKTSFIIYLKSTCNAGFEMAFIYLVVFRPYPIYLLWIADLFFYKVTMNHDFYLDDLFEILRKVDKENIVKYIEQVEGLCPVDSEVEYNTHSCFMPRNT